jgi:uncharacterized membrane protein YhaH (DUF805 family)
MDLKDWFSIDGKLSKEEFGKRALVCLLAPFILFWIPVLGWLLCLATFVALIFACVRRLTTLRKNAMLALILIVPFVNIVFVIWLALQG